MNDVEVKVEFYYRAGVPLYVIADAIRDDQRRPDALRLIAYRHAPGGVTSRFGRMPGVGSGWMRSALWLGVTQDPSVRATIAWPATTADRREIGDYTAV